MEDSGVLPDMVRRWRERGRFVFVAGLEVFVLETGPEEASTATMLLHGFPTSSFDWHRVLPLLDEGRRIVLFDFPGYGLSAKPTDYSYSLHEQADVVEGLCRTLGVADADLIAHDMGTSVACELMARRERGLLDVTVRSLLLMNGSVHIEHAQLTPSQILLRSPFATAFVRVASKSVFAWQLGRIVGRPLPDDDLDAMWALLNHRHGRARLPALIRYLDERRRFWHRWIGALTRLDVPACVLWGPEDPVAVPIIARSLADEIPDATLHWLDGLGHYPPLEAPQQTADALIDWLDHVAR